MRLPNQAFRFGETAYAVQFHVEVTGPMLAEWGYRAGLPGIRRGSAGSRRFRPPGGRVRRCSGFDGSVRLGHVHPLARSGGPDRGEEAGRRHPGVTSLLTLRTHRLATVNTPGSRLNACDHPLCMLGLTRLRLRDADHHRYQPATDVALRPQASSQTPGPRRTLSASCRAGKHCPLRCLNQESPEWLSAA
jgi:hypothetical protein